MTSTDTHFTLSTETIEQLKRMQAIATTVNGTTPATHPSRAVSVEYSALLASLVSQGATCAAIANALGVRPQTIKYRLVRHGHLPPAPSQVHLIYTGVAKKGGSAPREECRRGHPMSGNNLYVQPGGKRQCRACKQIRDLARAQAHQHEPAHADDHAIAQG